MRAHRLHHAALAVLAEIDRGAWYVLEPDAALVMRPPEGLWEHLVRRAQRAGSRTSS